MSLVAKFRQIIKSAYNYKEALERENLNHDDVEALRENLKSMEYVPKLIADEQVRRKL